MSPLSQEDVVAVIGAGTMGAGIAQVAADAGHSVLLYDAVEGAVEKGLERTRAGLDKLVDRGKRSRESVDNLMERIKPASSLQDFAGARLVVEAIVEDLEVKQKVFAEVEAACGEDAILATNTSSISITAIGASLSRPERLLGMHFFNPAPIMRLVEVVSGLATDPGVAETVHATAAAWGKHPVHARSTPGFIVNRVARPFYAEGLRVFEEGGADHVTIDTLLREAGGFRMGPFELTDLIGHDVNYAVTRSVFEAYYHDPRFRPSLAQLELVKANRLGRKSGRGFYDYREDATAAQAVTAPAVETPTQVSGEPAPIVLHGNPGPLQPLIALFEQRGLAVERREGPDGLLDIGESHLALTDGRPATTRAAREGIDNLILIDLALDYTQAPRLAVAPADQASDSALQAVVGLLQSVDKQVSVLDDVPGLVLMRTLAMLANEAADAVNQGVASAAGVDTAMRSGLNYPRGPLEWGEALGLGRIVDCLDNLVAAYGDDRYRVSPLLRRKVDAEGRFHE